MKILPKFLIIYFLHISDQFFFYKIHIWPQKLFFSKKIKTFKPHPIQNLHDPSLSIYLLLVYTIKKKILRKYIMEICEYSNFVS